MDRSCCSSSSSPSSGTGTGTALKREAGVEIESGASSSSAITAQEEESLSAAKVLTSLYQAASQCQIVKKGVETVTGGACPLVRKGLEIIVGPNNYKRLQQGPGRLQSTADLTAVHPDVPRALASSSSYAAASASRASSADADSATLPTPVKAEPILEAQMAPPHASLPPYTTIEVSDPRDSFGLPSYSHRGEGSGIGLPLHVTQRQELRGDFQAAAASSSSAPSVGGEGTGPSNSWKLNANRTYGHEGYHFGDIARCILRKLSEDFSMVKRFSEDLVLSGQPGPLPSLRWSLENCRWNPAPADLSSPGPGQTQPMAAPAPASQPVLPQLARYPRPKGSSIRDIISDSNSIGTQRRDGQASDTQEKGSRKRKRKKSASAASSSLPSADKAAKIATPYKPLGHHNATAAVAASASAAGSSAAATSSSSQAYLLPQNDPRVERIREAISLITTGGPEELEENYEDFFTNDLRCLLPEVIDIRGRAECLKYLYLVFEVCPDFTIIPSSISPEPKSDKIRTNGTVAGTHSGYLLGRAGTGRRLEGNLSGRVTFNDDLKICDIIFTTQNGWKAEISKIERIILGAHVAAIHKCSIM